MGCGGSRARTADARSPERPSSSTAIARTTAPNAQWTPQDIATFERLATGRAGTAIDIDHLTPAQLASTAREIRALHGRAEPDGHEERRALLLWAIGTPQVHVRICANLEGVIPLDADRPYTSELLLSLAASVIESPDGVEQQRAGLEGVLANYQASRATGADAQLQFETLLAERATDGLAARAAALAQCVGPGSVEPSARSGTSSRPRTPGRADVVAAMVAVSPAVGACLRGAGGAVTMRIEVASDGSVTSTSALAPDPTHAVAEVDVRGTETERCAAAALREARLPPFENETFSFSFPFTPR